MHHTYATRRGRSSRVPVEQTEVYFSRLEAHIRQALADACRFRNLSLFAFERKEMDAVEGFLASLNLLAEHHPQYYPRVTALVDRLVPKRQSV